MANFVYGGDLASTRYTAGTPAWNQALQSDLSSGYLTQGQYDWATQNPGMAIPIQAGAPTTQQSSWTSFWGGISDTANILFTGYARAQQMEYQRNLLEQNLEMRRLQIQGGLPYPAESGFGGLNVWTLLAFAGVALLVIMVLKKT